MLPKIDSPNKIHPSQPATKEEVQTFLNKMTNWQRNQLGKALKGNYKNVFLTQLIHFANLKHHKEIPYG